MRVFSKSLSVAAVALAAALTLSACSGDSSDSAVPETTTETAVVEETELVEGDPSPDGATEVVPEVDVDPELEALLNPPEGQAIVPNSVPVEVQENLSASCEEAVAPIRAIMAESGGLAASPETLAEAGELRAVVEETCDPQEYTDWYTKEFAGWLYQD